MANMEKFPRHQSKLILVSLGQHLTRRGGLVGGRVSPPYTDDFEFLFFFFFFFGGGEGGGVKESSL